MDTISLIILFLVWSALVVIVGGLASMAHERGELGIFLSGLWKDSSWTMRIGLPVLLLSVPAYLMIRLVTS